MVNSFTSLHLNYFFIDNWAKHTHTHTFDTSEGILNYQFSGTPFVPARYLKLFTLRHNSRAKINFVSEKKGEEYEAEYAID